MGSLIYTEQIKLASDTEFINRVRQAVLTTAIAIASEAATGKEIVNNARLSFATHVLREPEKYAKIMVHGVVTNTSGKSVLSDAEINNIVAAIWNAYAGVNPNIIA
jgi:hypothetical protein